MKFKKITALMMISAMLLTSCASGADPKDCDDATADGIAILQDDEIYSPWITDIEYVEDPSMEKVDITVTCIVNDEIADRMENGEDLSMKMYICKDGKGVATPVRSVDGEMFEEDGIRGFRFTLTVSNDEDDVFGTGTLMFVRGDGNVDSLKEVNIWRFVPIDLPAPADGDPTDCVFKPVIYLYPEEETDISVDLEINGDITCTYPQCDEENGWDVTASPDGRLFDRVTGRYYDYLFWEGDLSGLPQDYGNAICVPGSETAVFLEEYLGACGLNDSETDDFISYWLPKMQDNPYNLISFPNEEYCAQAQLNVSPAPDTVIRVFMVFTSLDSPMEIPQEDALEMPEGVTRDGFTLVEWGGCER